MAASNSVLSGSALTELLDAQRRAVAASGTPSYEQRLDALRRLEQVLQAHREDLARAISDDFGGRAREETILLELFPLLGAIRHARANLYEWMRPVDVPVDWQFRPARARILKQPLGVVGIMGAWNYPWLLILAPLVDALAAGNRVMLKPSEAAPNCAALLQRLIGDTFPADYVTVVNGGPDVGAAFSRLGFDHLLYTGSAAVGKLVMKAASETLTPVTLELGGKSPAIVHDLYPIERAFQRIVKGKLYNAGQTCIAPDYVLVAEDRLDEAVSIAQHITAKLYPALVANSDYTRIMNLRHYERVAGLVQDARDKGARVIAVNPAAESCNSANRVLPPTIVTGVRDDMSLASEEIFGPVLPLIGYRTLADAISYVNARPKPLALYYFDSDRARIDQLLASTSSGTAAVNDVVLQIAQNHLPFGGVGPSGMGRYRGIHGFETFSNRRSVFEQRRFAFTDYFKPPYARVRRVMEWLVR